MNKCPSCSCKDIYKSLCRKKASVLHKAENNNDFANMKFNFKEGGFSGGWDIICLAEFCNNCESCISSNNYKIEENSNCKNCNCVYGKINNINFEEGYQRIIIHGSCTNCEKALSCTLIKKGSLVGEIKDKLLN